jgi:Peptidase A4 family
MNRYRSVVSRFALSKPFGVIGMALILCLAAAAWSKTGAKNSPTPQFTLKAIPVSAVHPSWQVPRIRNKNGTSSNWSGYAVHPLSQASSQNTKGKGNGKGNGGGGKPSGGSSPTFSDVTGSWSVPNIVASGSANTYSSTWVGLDGYSDGTVEQIGIEQDWSNGGPQYYAWFEMYPKFGYEIVGFPVNPGDTISAEVEYTGKGAFTLTITNLSVNDKSGNFVRFSTTQRAPSAQRLSAEWIEEAPWSGGVLPLADFGTVDFSDCYATMDSYTGPIKDTQWQYDRITMETSGGMVKAQPSVLKGSGTSFSVTWYHE